MPENEDTIISYGQTKTKSTLCPVVASACQVTLTWLTWGRTTLHTAWSHSSQNSPDSQESGRKLQGFHYWYSVHYWAAYPISDQILETRILFPWSASYGKRKETIKYRGARSDRIRAISDDHQGEEIDRDQSRPWSNSSSPRKFLRRCPRSINFKLKFTWRARLHLRLGFRQSPRVPHFPHYSETSLLPHCPAPIPSPLAVVAACIHFKILIDRVIDRFWRLSDRIGSDRQLFVQIGSDRIEKKMGCDRIEIVRIEKTLFAHLYLRYVAPEAAAEKAVLVPGYFNMFRFLTFLQAYLHNKSYLILDSQLSYRVDVFFFSLSMFNHTDLLFIAFYCQ